jgi:CubicO group peptidase (beta-lactamase class C family)
VAGAGFEQLMGERLFAPLGMASSTYTWRADLAERLVTGHDREGRPWPVFWTRYAPRLLEVARQRDRPLASFTADEVRAALRGATPAVHDRPEYMVPNAASSLVTTAGDYGAFLAAALGGGPAAVALAPETRRAMVTAQTRVNRALAWGLGWGIERAAGPGPGDFLWQWGDNGSWKNFASRTRRVARRSSCSPTARAASTSPGG